MDFDITCIEFSEEIRGRVRPLIGNHYCAALLSEETRNVIDAIRRSGVFLRMAKGHQEVIDDSTKEKREEIMAEALQAEREFQQALKSAGITDDTTADRWLTSIEKKLTIARSEYQKLSDRQAAEREDFCKQWMVG